MAADPATNGAASDVPLEVRTGKSTPSSQSPSAAAVRMLSPGATMSGLKRPSGYGELDPDRAVPGVVLQDVRRHFRRVVVHVNGRDRRLQEPHHPLCRHAAGQQDNHSHGPQLLE
eukprot:1392896-Rhodomonas_salina.2